MGWTRSFISKGEFRVSSLAGLTLLINELFHLFADISTRTLQVRRLDLKQCNLPLSEQTAWIGQSIGVVLLNPKLTSLLGFFGSLDRTNVVQSALGKWVLNNQLRQAGVLSVKESIDEHPVFLDLFRNSESSVPSLF